MCVNTAVFETRRTFLGTATSCIARTVPRGDGAISATYELGSPPRVSKMCWAHCSIGHRTCPRPALTRSPTVTQRFARRDQGLDQSFELCSLWESAVAFSLPNQLTVGPNAEGSRRGWGKRQLLQLGGESREQLLRKPRGAQEPTTLRAIFDDDVSRCHPSFIRPSVAAYQPNDTLTRPLTNLMRRLVGKARPEPCLLL